MITEAAAKGHLPGLEAVRDRLAAEIDSSGSPRDVAALGRLLVEVLAQIDDLSGSAGVKKETGLSDFEERLRERESGAKGSRRPASS